MMMNKIQYKAYVKMCRELKIKPSSFQEISGVPDIEKKKKRVDIAELSVARKLQNLEALEAQKRVKIPSPKSIGKVPEVKVTKHTPAEKNELKPNRVLLTEAEKKERSREYSKKYYYQNKKSEGC